MRLKNKNILRPTVASWTEKGKKITMKIAPGGEFNCPDAVAKELVKKYPNRWAFAAKTKPESEEKK